MSKEQFLALAEGEFEQLQKLHEHDNFYDYEKDFDAIWTRLGGRVLQETLGEKTNDHRKKTASEPGTEK